MDKLIQTRKGHYERKTRTNCGNANIWINFLW